jgi:hypothetical protein
MVAFLFWYNEGCYGCYLLYAELVYCITVATAQKHAQATLIFEIRLNLHHKL